MGQQDRTLKLDLVSMHIRLRSIYSDI